MVSAWPGVHPYMRQCRHPYTGRTWAGKIFHVERRTLWAMPSLPPASTSPASAFEIADIIEQKAPPVILADMIDPVTGDFASLTRGRPLADAFAIEALRVQRGTGAAVRDSGNRFREVRNVESNAVEVIESMAREAFTDAERAGVAELSDVSVEVDELDTAQVNTVIEYRDLLAPRDDQTRRLIFSR
jgi:hypothetical protein